MAPIKRHISIICPGSGVFNHIFLEIIFNGVSDGGVQFLKHARFLEVLGALYMTWLPNFRHFRGLVQIKRHISIICPGGGDFNYIFLEMTHNVY